MLQPDARFSAAVEALVGQIERRTDAEVVVVAAPRSGGWRDLSVLVGAGAAALTLVGVLFSPVVVSPGMVLVDVLVSGAVGAWLGAGAWSVRWLASADRRRAQVDDGAAATFHREAVHATTERVGLLVYWSGSEGLVRLIPDLGVEAAAPDLDWAALSASFRTDDLPSFEASLRAVGDALAERLPRTRPHTADGLADAPRILA